MNKKERPDLGAAFIATNKKSPQSYDLSGTIVVDELNISLVLINKRLVEKANCLKVLSSILSAE